MAEEPQTPNLKVSVSASFPQSEIFGIKLPAFLQDKLP